MILFVMLTDKEINIIYTFIYVSINIQILPFVPLIILYQKVIQPLKQCIHASFELSSNKQQHTSYKTLLFLSVL